MGLLSTIETALTKGPFFAVAKSQLESKAPLDAVETWRFWTRQWPKAVKVVADNYPPRPLAARMLRQIDLEEGRDAIRKHYDISNDFFMLILDKDYHFYSCADFQPGDTLEAAQRRKAMDFLRRLDLKPGQQLLELGCGWGAMMRFLRDHGPDDLELNGYTLSKAQAEYIGQSSNFGVEVRDFARSELPEGAFDRIYSMGAWEHVLPEEIPPLLERLHCSLRPGGRMVHQYSVLLKPGTPATFLLGNLIFSGFRLLSRDAQVKAAEYAGFRLIEETDHDYRPSWKAWYDNLAANRDYAIGLGSVTEYNRYLLLFIFGWMFMQERYAIIKRFTFERV